MKSENVFKINNVRNQGSLTEIRDLYLQATRQHGNSPTGTQQRQLAKDTHQNIFL